MDSQVFSYIVGLIISGAVAYWIYTDATKRGANAVIWAIFGFFFSLITLIVWLIMRPKGTRVA